MTDVPIRPAATVMLVRDGNAGPEVYMLRRVAEMTFAGGMTAFPGGGVDARDAAPIGWSGPGPSWWAAKFGIDVDLARRVVSAAVRELFEETGVLLADLPAGSPGFTAAGLEAFRLQIAGHRAGLDALVGTGKVRADLLRPWARWVTPPGQPRRYDTFFLLALPPEGASPRMLTSEAETGEWIRPPDALEAAARGEIAMMPPTVAMLGSLAAIGSAAAMLTTDRDIRTVEATVVSAPGEPMRVRAGDDEFAALGLPISRS
jgi:8-oxo-dGTP pyrophosphatase MutT (NUDIX family)